MTDYIADGTVAKLSQEDTGTAYGSATFDTLGQLSGFSLPGISVPLIDVTHLGDSAREHLQGIPDYGEGSFEVNWDPASTSAHAYMKAAALAKEPRWLEITLSDADSTVVYWGIRVTEVGSADGSEGDKVTCSFSFKATTDVTVV